MKYFKQLFPVFLTIITFLVLSFALFIFIHLLNLFPIKEKIVPQLRITDVLVGLTIYLKTSVDFAIFIGNLMSKYLGIKNRIAIEIGTALGNASGTFFVLLIWTFFKEVPFLMILMIFLAALVLFSMAEEGLSGFMIEDLRFTIAIRGFQYLKIILYRINSLFRPIIRFIIPHATNNASAKTTFFSLLVFALTIPLILGLDDFAGYIPLFNIINVFGFAIGVFLGHMLLNIALFASPKHTVAVVKQPLVGLLGSLAFVGIGLWGFVEIFHLLFSK